MEGLEKESSRTKREGEIVKLLITGVVLLVLFGLFLMKAQLPTQFPGLFLTWLIVIPISVTITIMITYGLHLTIRNSDEVLKD